MNGVLFHLLHCVLSAHRLLLLLQADWLKFGFLLSVVYLSIWLGVGGVWWKAIGLW